MDSFRLYDVVRQAEVGVTFFRHKPFIHTINVSIIDVTAACKTDTKLSRWFKRFTGSPGRSGRNKNTTLLRWEWRNSLDHRKQSTEVQHRAFLIELSCGVNAVRILIGRCQFRTALVIYVSVKTQIPLTHRMSNVTILAFQSLSLIFVPLPHPFDPPASRKRYVPLDYFGKPSSINHPLFFYLVCRYIEMAQSSTIISSMSSNACSRCHILGYFRYGVIGPRERSTTCVRIGQKYRKRDTVQAHGCAGARKE